MEKTTFQSEEGSQEKVILGLFPDTVLCLNSALYYYRYITQKPYVWHLAVDKHTVKTRFQIEYPFIKPFYMEPEVLTLGVVKIPFGGGKMNIYSRERMMCDCLKYEEKLDRETLKRALLSYLADEKKDIPMLLEMAKQRKVLKKVRYMIGVWL